MAIQSKNFVEFLHMGRTATDRGPSEAIWEDCPVLELQNNPMLGSHFMTDFTGEGVVCATNKTAAEGVALGTTGPFGARTTTAALITTANDDVNGVARITSGTTDNAGATLFYPSTAVTAGTYKFSSGNKLWFECRIAKSNIANNIGNLFIGLATFNKTGNADLITTSDAMHATLDCVGWRQLAAAGATIAGVCQKTGQSALTTTGATHTMKAATYVKLGFTFNGFWLTFYVNGVAMADPVAITTAHFPDAYMAFYMSTMNAATTSVNYDLDWLRIGHQIG